jgi:hypothetical protein
VLQKLGRVLREKAATDLDRILHGASKTRERLGVRPLCFFSPAAAPGLRAACSRGCGASCKPCISYEELCSP